MELKEIQQLIKMLDKSNVGEIKIEQKDFKISIRAKGFENGKSSNGNISTAIPIQTVVSQPIAAAPQIAAEPAQQAEAPKAAEGDKLDEGNLITIKSPMIGTFYRSPAPDKPAFINIGDTIKEGDVLCIIEAMKLFNEIENEVNGKVVKVLIDDASPVEYDQPLFLVEPA